MTGWRERPRKDAVQFEANTSLRPLRHPRVFLNGFSPSRELLRVEKQTSRSRLSRNLLHSDKMQKKIGRPKKGGFASGPFSASVVTPAYLV